MNKFITTKEIRPYKIEIYGLQDNFIGTLQSYNDDFIGQVIEPEVNLSKDGTSTFKCSIPKYYIDPKTNNRVLNPHWEDVISGVLVENVRILKAYMIINNRTRVFPFIIDSIIDKRDAHYSVYKEISASGLAFAELGKVGYKLELNQNTAERDFEKDETVVPTIQYWLDKVFPNVKNEDGAITEWLTPWCYEIRMDWSSYWAGSDGKYDNTKIYEEPYIDSWKEQDGSINPSGFVYGEEKARYLDVSGSNKYNITQDIAKTFEVFCYYEYTTDDKGQFIKTYVDEDNKRWTGRKVIFYNNAINMSNPFYVDYQKNLNSINKQIESSEVYTKMYVQPQESELMTNGYITIADTPSNPLLDDFILNFDYLKQTNNLTEYQLDFINQYKLFFREKNLDLIALTPTINTMAVEVNNIKSDISLVEKEVSSAQEEQQHYKTLADNETTNVEIVKDENNSYSTVFVPQDDEYKWYRAEVRLEGADASSIKGYKQHDYKTSLFDSVTTRTKVEFNIDNQNLLLGSNKKIITKNSYFMTSYAPVSPLKPGETYTASISITAPADLDEIGLFVSDGYIALTRISTEEGQQIITGTFTMPNYAAGKTPEEDAKYAKVQLYRYPNDLLSNEITINWIKIEKGNVATPWEPALKEGPCYALLDTYGFATALYTMNTDIGENGVTYLKLQYSPVNKYNAIVSHLDGIIGNGNDRINELKAILASKEDELKALTEQYNSIIRQKDELDIKLEKILGPALREGYWTPDTYEDVQDTKIKDINTSSPEWVWDSKVFEGEEEGYYLDGINDQGEAAKVYKQYILCDDLFGLNNLDALKNSGELQLVLQRDYSSESVSREYNQGNYFIQHNGVKYYFSLEKDYPEEVNAYFILTAKGSTITLYLIDTNTPKTEIPLSTRILEDAANLSGIFEGNNTTLQNYVLYNNSGFTYAFAQIEGAIVPIVILQKKPDELQHYTRIGYSFSNTSEITEGAELVSLIKTLSADLLVYPRIQFVEKNVNYDSNLNKLIIYFSNEYNEVAADNIILEKYYDYSILVRDGTPYLTLKFSKNNNLYNFLYGKNHLVYKISRANEWLYLDALQVAKENAFPKVSYELSVGNIPEKINDVEIGQLVYISDFTLGIHAANGYISDITYKLHSPKDDEIKIQNYKTKFEDLFSSISATNEAMKTSQNTYKVIASGFEPSGLLSTETLQNSINSGDLYFNYSNTGVEISPTRGIVLTNVKPYLNGVYGQVALQGGGIYLSNSVHPDTGERIWNTSITPMGINASLITAGQLNTNLIRIYADDQMAFQWNGEGIFAYGTKEGKTNIDEYVRYSKDGLHYTKRFSPESEPINLVSLDWDGFALKNNQGNDTLKVDRETGDLTLSGNMQSYNYADGALGSGWRIDQNGHAEFNNVSIRGTISASVFEYEKTSSIGGSLYISPTLIINNTKDNNNIILYRRDNTNGGMRYSLYIEIPSPFSELPASQGGRNWAAEDLVGFNGIIISGKERYEIRNLRMRILPLDDTNPGRLTLKSENNAFSYQGSITQIVNANNEQVSLKQITKDGGESKPYIYEDSINLIYLGNSEGKTGILLTTTEDSSGPFIDIYGATKEGVNSKTPKVRLGDLSGLGELDEIKALYPEIGGYGLYADNVWLRGQIYAGSGQIGGWAIGEKRLYSSAVNKGGNPTDQGTTFFIGMDANPKYHYAFWAGNASAVAGDSTEINTATCSFRVTKSGRLYADAGAVGGWTLEKNSLHSGSGKNYVALNSTTSDYAIWAGDTDTEVAPFSVTKKGALKSTSGEIGGWMIDESSLHSIVENNESVNNYVYLRSKGLEDGGNVEECIFQYGYSLNPEDTTPTEWKTWADFKEEIEDLYNSDKENIWLSTRRIITYDTKNQKVELPELLYQYTKQDDNRMLSEVVVSYCATNSTSIPNNPNWDTKLPVLSEDKRFLWQKGSYTITNSDGTVTKTVTTSPVIISSFEKNLYAIWAGGKTGQSSPFAVTQDGKVYATNLIIRTLQEGSTTQYTEKNIMDYPLWAIWSAYSGRVTGLTSSQADDGTVTLTLTTGKEEHIVNFKKPAPPVPIGASIGTLVGGDESENSAYTAMIVVKYDNGTESDFVTGNVLAGNAGNPWRAGKKAGQASVGIEGKWENGVFKVQTVYDPEEVNTTLETSSISLSEEWDGRFLRVSAYTDEISLASETYDGSTFYNNGMDAAAATLFLYPGENKSLGYGESLTVRATVQNSSGTVEKKEFTVTAPGKGTIGSFSITQYGDGEGYISATCSCGASHGQRVYL